mmetsp:Transcript_16840/g.16093  ORF Transcript_16840/g.16093 Transcript_16840/m.16093 type:complete len:86 (-) Transcript_16840:637-894(-)
MNPTGIGLGLTICNKILEQFGSQLEVDSVQGQGTTFFFILEIPTQPEHVTCQDVELSMFEDQNLEQTQQLHRYCDSKPAQRSVCS